MNNVIDVKNRFVIITPDSRTKEKEQSSIHVHKDRVMVKFEKFETAKVYQDLYDNLFIQEWKDFMDANGIDQKLFDQNDGLLQIFVDEKEVCNNRMTDFNGIITAYYLNQQFGGSGILDIYEQVKEMIQNN